MCAFSFKSSLCFWGMKKKENQCEELHWSTKNTKGNSKCFAQSILLTNTQNALTVFKMKKCKSFYFEEARPSENLIIRPYPIDGDPGNVCVLGPKRSGVISIFVHQKHSFRSRKTAQDLFPGSIVSVGLEALKTLNMTMLAITEQDVHQDSERCLMN